MTHVPDSPSMSFLAEAQYLREIKWAEPADDEERKKCLGRLLRGNRERVQAHPNQWMLSLATHARERLVEINQPLVLFQARKWMMWAHTGVELLDLVQEGNLSLIEALDVCTEDDLQDIPFLRYISRAIARGMSRLCKAERRQIAESLQAHLFEDEQEEDLNFTALYAASSAAERERQEELSVALCQAIDAALTPEQRNVVGLRYGMSDEPLAEHAPFEVARTLRLTPSTVQSRERASCRRLAAALHPVICEKTRQVVYQLDEVYQDEYYTIEEAAQLLGVPRSRLNQWVRQNKLAYEVRHDAASSCSHPMRVFSRRALLALVQSGVVGTLTAARCSALLPSVVA